MAVNDSNFMEYAKTPNWQTAQSEVIKLHHGGTSSLTCTSAEIIIYALIALAI
jgi:hypothetical protein